MSSGNPIHPPVWLDHFLEWYCSDELIDEIQGDLYEGYQERLKRLGANRANWWYFINVFRFFRPSSFAKMKTQKGSIMIHSNYFKVAFRNFSKHRSFTAINLLGLVLGTASCLLIALHVLKEVSFDTFHPDTENTYRVTMNMYKNGSLSANSAVVFPAVGPGLKEDFPEVLEYIRILPFAGGVYSVEKSDGRRVRFNEENAVLADENFFEIMGFDLIKGDTETALSEADQIVLSESSAQKYFGEEDPIGKAINYRGIRTLVVSGVMKDFPDNSHMQFDMIQSLRTFRGFEEWPQNWGWYDFYTFIRVQEGADLPYLKQKLSTYLDGKKAETYAERGSREELKLRNISDIHLYAKGLSWDMGENGGANQVYFLSVIAFMILVIAWVNFVNLTTARSIKRAREVGIRKVVGARRSYLIMQFLVEAFVLNFIAVLVSVTLAIFLVPLINNGLETSLDRSILLSGELIGALAALVIIGSILSGLYPAVLISSFRPIEVLKGSFLIKKTRFTFRQVLVTFQFATSVVLIIGTLVVIKQLDHMQSQDLGLNLEQTLSLRAPSSRVDGDLAERKEVFANEITQLPSVKSLTVSTVVPGVENFNISGFNTRDQPDVNRDCYRIRVDHNYFDQFDIEVLAGRNFMKDLASDSNSVLLNETAIKLFGFESPEEALGEVLNPNSRWRWKVIGVVKDYHHASLKKGLDPIMFYYAPNSGGYYSLKIGGQDVKGTVESIEKVWDKIYPDNAFEFFFLDQHFDKQYKSDAQFNAVFLGFAVLAIIVACLGLFGLVSFNVEQTRKEIGIRKVLGASLNQLLMLLSKEYLVLLAIALLVALPLGYYVMRIWLEDFAYQTTIGGGIFLFGGFVIIVLTLLTVSFRSVSAAQANPVESLRDE